MGETVAAVLERTAGVRGDALWLVFERPDRGVETTSWAQALERAEATAALLAAHGVGPGDRVGVHLTNRPERPAERAAAAQQHRPRVLHRQRVPAPAGAGELDVSR
jgi:acyl-CoA synthetase (AMP-forming)/AMP-acid ligase II